MEDVPYFSIDDSPFFPLGKWLVLAWPKHFRYLMLQLRVTERDVAVLRGNCGDGKDWME
jgi:hypothetical protein